MKWWLDWPWRWKGNRYCMDILREALSRPHCTPSARLHLLMELRRMGASEDEVRRYLEVQR